MTFIHAPLRAALPVRTGLLNYRQWLPLPQRNNFHTSRPLRDDTADDKNHYETLNVRHDASHAEIKKSFYTLSKTHHPDHNPSHPQTSARKFQRLSEAYHVLSHADRRARYDRDVLRLQHSSHTHHHAMRKSGSYSSTGPAGGRPASGLSRRRGTFTGPPPSFYRSGGWGAHSAKRRAQHEETTGMGSGAGRGEEKGGETDGVGGAGGVGGGMGPGQDPLHRTGGAGHFDHERHERMHRRRDEAGRARRKEEREPEYVDTGLWFRFVIFGGIIVGAAYGPYWMGRNMGGTTTKQQKRAV